MSILARDGQIFGERTVGLTLSGTQYSDAFNPMVNWSVHFEWTGTPAGDVTLWASDKLNPSLANDTDWVQDTGFTLAYGGAAGKALQEVGNSGARWYRFKSVLSGSSGTVLAWVNDKPQER